MGGSCFSHEEQKGVLGSSPQDCPLKDVLEQLRELNGDQDYAFFTGRTGKYPHMHPSSINSHLIKMGYKGMLVGHGVRHFFL